MSEDIPDQFTPGSGRDPDVPEPKVAGVALPWWMPYPEYATAMMTLTAFIMGQQQFNFDFFREQFKSVNPIQGFFRGIYRWMLGTYSLQHFRDFREFVDALPEPFGNMMRCGTLTHESYEAMCRDKNVLALAKRGIRNVYGNGPLYEDEYNHKILAEHADGKIKPVDYDRIISMFQETPKNHWQKPKDLPRIIFTASHAMTETFKDLTTITHGIEAMARDSWGEKLKLITPDPDQKVREGNTMILFASDTDQHFLHNGLALQERLNEIEHAHRTGEPDQFHHICDGSRRIAMLMLACMCENYYQDDGKGGTQPLFNIDDPRSLREIFADGRPSIQLNADAGRIAQHFQLVGYSKAGNTVTDAMRYLDAQLQEQIGGRSVVKFSMETDYRVGMHRMGDYGLRSILHNIMIASIAARELPLTEQEKRHGIQRVAFNNENDRVTEHCVYPSTWNDECYKIKGTTTKGGHDPEDMMGTADRVVAPPGYRYADYNPERRGFALDDPDVERRMKEFFAPHYGKAVIANVFAEDGRVKFETATGTTDALLAKHGDTITAALEKAGLSQVKIHGDGHAGIADLHCSENLLRDPAALEKLQQGFTGLRESADGLMIAQSIDERISDLMEKAKSPFASAAKDSKKGKGKGKGDD